MACYSQHPLVGLLKVECEKLSAAATRGSDGRGAHKYVTGIFEASVLASLALVDNQKFGIVSTGKIWEEALQSAVEDLLGGGVSKFAGCETTGLNASELHDLPADQVKEKMMEATRRLLLSSNGKDKNVRAICLGCAGMVGLESAVRTACVDTLGAEAGKHVAIVDGVKAGVGLLYGLVRAGF